MATLLEAQNSDPSYKKQLKLRPDLSMIETGLKAGALGLDGAEMGELSVAPPAEADPPPAPDSLQPTSGIRSNILAITLSVFI